MQRRWRETCTARMAPTRSARRRADLVISLYMPSCSKYSWMHLPPTGAHGRLEAGWRLCRRVGCVWRHRVISTLRGGSGLPSCSVSGSSSSPSSQDDGSSPVCFGPVALVSPGCSPSAGSSSISSVSLAWSAAATLARSSSTSTAAPSAGRASIAASSSAASSSAAASSAASSANAASTSASSAP